MSFTRRLSRTLYSAPALTVGLAGLCYGLYQRWLMSTIYGTGVPIGLWDIILEVTASPEFLISVIVPSWLLYSVIRSQRLTELVRLIRLGSNRATLADAYRTAIMALGATCALLLVAWAIAAVGLPLRSSPTSASVAGVFAEAHIAPLFAFLLQGIVLFFALLTVYGVVIVLRLLPGRSFTPVVFSLGIWLWTICCLLGLVKSASPFHASHFLDAAAIVDDPAAGLPAIALLVLVMLGTWACAIRLDHTNGLRGADLLRSPLGFGVGASGVLVLAIIGTDPTHSTFSRSVGIIAEGTSGTVVQGLVWNFLFLGLAYLVQLRLADQRRGFVGLQLIRYGTVEAWLLRQLGNQAVWALLYLVGAAGITGLAYLALGGRDFSQPTNGAGVFVFQFVVNGFLQLILYSLIVTALSIVTASPLAGLVSLAILLVLSWAYVDPHGWNPAGAASMIRAEVGWGAVLTATLTLVISISLAAFATLFCVRTRKATF